MEFTNLHFKKQILKIFEKAPNLIMRVDHRDKTRVQMPAKIFPHLKVKC
jgi:hypothetical protein